MMLGARKGLDDRIASRFMAGGYIQGFGSAVLEEKKAYYIPVQILTTCELTGVMYEIGGTKNGKVIGGIYNEEGGRLAKSAEVEQNTAEFFQLLPFTEKIIVNPALYWLSIISNSATATAYGAFNFFPNKIAAEAAFALPNNFAVPAGLNNSGKRIPILSTY